MKHADKPRGFVITGASAGVGRMITVRTANSTRAKSSNARLWTDKHRAVIAVGVLAMRGRRR